MRKPFFAADLHFRHKNIIGYANRPFRSIDEMDKVIIENWNSIVEKKDVVYLLGDIGFLEEREGKILRKLLYGLNGLLYLIKGNHDKKPLKLSEIRERFTWIGDYLEIKVNDPDVNFHGNRSQKIVLFHYPITSWNGMYNGAWHLHGHCHGSYFDQKNKQLDVGIDCWNYTPVSYEQVKEFMNTREFTAVDGNGKMGIYKDYPLNKKGQ